MIQCAQRKQIGDADLSTNTDRNGREGCPHGVPGSRRNSFALVDGDYYKKEGVPVSMSKLQRIIATVFLLVGLILLGVGAYLGIVPAIPKEFTGTAQATITDISVSYGNTTTNGRRSERHNVLVEYEVDGESYQRQLGFYTTDMAVGQKVDIEYDTREPGSISSPGSRLFGTLICLGLGAVFAVLGAVLQFKPVPVFVNGRRVA